MVLLRAGGTRCSFDRAYRARLPSLRPRGAGATARDTVKAAAAASGRPHETAGAPDQFLDYYKLLGVEPSCAQADLKRAYRCSDPLPVHAAQPASPIAAESVVYPAQSSYDTIPVPR